MGDSWGRGALWGPRGWDSLRPCKSLPTFPGEHFIPGLETLWSPQEGSEELSEGLQNPQPPSPPYSSLQDPRMVPSKGWADAQEGWGPGASSRGQGCLPGGGGPRWAESRPVFRGLLRACLMEGTPHLCTPGAQGFSRARASPPAETPASLPPGVAVTL